MIPYGRQNISESDIAAVIEVLKSDWLTQGPVVPKFEGKLCDLTGANFACAVNSATSALHLACLALGLGEGDILWTSPNTFVASSNCALYCGAKVDFVDIDINTGNMSTAQLEEKLIEANKVAKLPKIVIPVHFAGQACDMREIKQLADKFGFKVIEDASHATGASYQGEEIGSCKYSDITIFSFHPVKIITSGEGGALLCNDEKLATKIKLMRSHGISKEEALMQNKAPGSWYYEQLMLGFNYRMTDIQAALGLSQLARLKQFLAKRIELANRYNHEFSKLPVKALEQKTDRRSAWHLYVIKLPDNNRIEVFAGLKDKNIGVQVHYIPVHLQPYYRNLGFKPGDFPMAEKYYSQAISLPLFPDLTKENQDYVINSLKELLI